MRDTDVRRPVASPARHDMPFVEGIRALSATYVVFHHIWQFAISNPTTPPPSWFKVVNVFEFGALGVAVFVVVSGYCLMLPVMAQPGEQLPGGVRRFATRRTLRIVPPYYAALVATSVLLLSFGDLRAPSGTPQDITLPTFTWSKSLAHVFMIHNWSEDWRWGINPPHWSVALEFQIYFVFALLLLPVWRRYGRSASVGLGFAIALLLFALGYGFAAPWMLGLFAVGMLGAALSVSTPRQERIFGVGWGPAALVAALAVPVAVAGAHKVTTGDAASMIGDVAIGVATMLCLVWLSHRHLAEPSTPSLVGSALTLRPVRFLGAISYSTYLLHYPIVAAVTILFVGDLDLGVPATFALIALVSWPIILVVSVVFHRLVERPSRSHRPPAA